MDYFKDKFYTYIYSKHNKIIRNIIKYHAEYITQIVFSNEVIPLLSLCIAFIMSTKAMVSKGSIIVIFNVVSNIMASIESLGSIKPNKRSAELLEERLDNLFEDDKYKQEYRYEKMDDFKKLDIDISSYIYDKDKKILENVKLEVNKNDFVIIKGESGKGKTSLINLISRFIDKDKLDGNINIMRRTYGSIKYQNTIRKYYNVNKI